MKKIIGLSGSHSEPSINSQLIANMGQFFPEHEFQVLDLSKYPAPFYQAQLEKEQGIPETIVKLKEEFKKADAFVISIPEYNGSYPAFFKNTIDWLSRIERGVFGNKPVLLLSATPGPRGGVDTLGNTGTLIGRLKGVIVGTYGIGEFKLKAPKGVLTEEVHRNHLRELSQVLVNKSAQV